VTHGAIVAGLAKTSGDAYFELPPDPPDPPPVPPELGESRLFLALSGCVGPGVLEVPGVTGSEVRGAGPIPREPDPTDGGPGGGAVVVWASAAPARNVVTPAITMIFSNPQFLSAGPSGSQELAVHQLCAFWDLADAPLWLGPAPGFAAAQRAFAESLVFASGSG
jgi:hypothetical protein